MKVIFNRTEEYNVFNENDHNPINKMEEAIIDAGIFDMEGYFDEEYDSLNNLAIFLKEEYGGSYEFNMEWLEYMVENNIITIL
jgi:hypothetical protein